MDKSRRSSLPGIKILNYIIVIVLIHSLGKLGPCIKDVSHAQLYLWKKYLRRPAFPLRVSFSLRGS